jgi:hypothetical protein
MKDIMTVSMYDFQNTSPGRIDGKNSGAVVEIVPRVFDSAGLQYFVCLDIHHTSTSYHHKNWRSLRICI